MNQSDSITRSWVFRLIILNCLVYLLQSVVTDVDLRTVLGISPVSIIAGFKFWQFFTYMFSHNDPMHLLFNMYALFMFGLAVEDVWGSKKFLIYYLFCGIGAGLVIFLIGFLQGTYFSITVGASGAIFGLLLAFGYLFPEAEILLFFVIPMKARMMVIVFGALELFMEFSGGMGNVSHVGHLGGLLFGLIYIFLIDRRRPVRRKFSEAAKKVASLVAQETLLHKKEELLGHNSLKISVLNKLNNGEGIESLTDDEYQMIKLLDIVTEAGTFPGKKELTEDDLNDRIFLQAVKKVMTIK